eukprot:5808650-Amphidinium_carterae.1
MKTATNNLATRHHMVLRSIIICGIRPMGFACARVHRIREVLEREFDLHHPSLACMVSQVLAEVHNHLMVRRDMHIVDVCRQGKHQSIALAHVFYSYFSATRHRAIPVRHLSQLQGFWAHIPVVILDNLRNLADVLKTGLFMSRLSST